MLGCSPSGAAYPCPEKVWVDGGAPGGPFEREREREREREG